MHTFHKNFLVDLPIVAAANSDLNTSYIQPFADGYGADRCVYMLTLGAAANTVDMALYQATDNVSSGTGRKAITGASITQIATTGDESFATIELHPNALDTNNGFTWVRAEVTVGGSDTAIYSVHVLRYRLRYAGAFSQPAKYVQAVEVY